MPKALAVALPIRSPVKDPGPALTAIASISSFFILDFTKVLETRGISVSECVTLKGPCSYASIRPSLKTAAEATAPELSIAKTIIYSYPPEIKSCVQVLFDQNTNSSFRQKSVYLFPPLYKAYTGSK